MGRVRWVCLSDLHLGALNSVLTSVTTDGLGVDRSSPASTVTALAACLSELHDRAGAPPELVVLGDLFELALTSTETAAATFGQFVAQLRVGQPDAAVAPLIRFVPGNHDHRLWTQARDANYLAYLKGVAGGDTDLPDSRHATQLFPEQEKEPIRDAFVELLAARAGLGVGVEVHQSYPNLGMVSSDGRRAVVLSHGHFVEPLYRLMSNLDVAFGVARAGRLPEVGELEAANAAWIDFFWSNMGDSGDITSVVSNLYESLQSPEAMALEIEAIRRFFAEIRPGWRGRLEAAALATVLREEILSRLQRERHRPEVSLSPAAQGGLADYLRGPVLAQLSPVKPVETTFVFGHTHKPFVEARSVEGVPGSVSVVNTGGWVVDSVAPEANKGAAVVVIDDDANVVVVRCYTEGTDAASFRAGVMSGDGDPENPLVQQLARVVDPGRDPWRALGQALQETVQVRREQLKQRLAENAEAMRRAQAASVGRTRSG